MGIYKKQKIIEKTKRETKGKKKRNEGIGWRIFTTSENSAGCQF